MAEGGIDDDRIAAFCGVLLDHGVEFVVIGGVAARLHDTGHATVDIDVCPSSVEENLERLAEALRSIGARLRVEGVPEGVPFDPHPQQLRASCKNDRSAVLKAHSDLTDQRERAGEVQRRAVATVGHHRTLRTCHRPWSRPRLE